MKPVAQAFEELGVAYAVVGSVAGLSHGYGRNTIDVDVLAEMPLSVVEEFAHRFEGDYYVDAAAIRDAIQHRLSFNLYHFDTGIKIDVFVSKERPYDLQVTARREPETMSDGTTPAFHVQSAEDLVLSKIWWFRQGGETSDRQWSDILAVLKVQQFVIDLAYLTRWAHDLKVEDLLDRALDEAGLKDIEE